MEEIEEEDELWVVKGEEEVGEFEGKWVGKVERLGGEGVMRVRVWEEEGKDWWRRASK